MRDSVDLTIRDSALITKMGNPIGDLPFSGTNSNFDKHLVVFLCMNLIRILNYGLKDKILHRHRSKSKQILEFEKEMVGSAKKCEDLTLALLENLNKTIDAKPFPYI